MVDNERPPYVKFEIRPVEDRDASLKAGSYVAKDVTFVIIQRPGDRDTVEKEADGWLADMKAKSRSGLIPLEWYKAYENVYEAFKQDMEPPIDGTPVKNWPVLAPSQVHTLIAAGVKTVEDLAAIPDGDISRIIMGGIGLKQKANVWLSAAKDVGTVVEKLNNALLQVSDLTALVQQLTAELAEVRAKSEPAKATASAK
jgi:hypothetical protein